MNFGKAQAEVAEKYRIATGNDGLQTQTPPLWAIRSKKERAKVRAKKIKSEMPTDDYFIYQVNGERRYYKTYQDLPDFLGMGKCPETYSHKVVTPSVIVTPSVRGSKCCYCGVKLGLPDNKYPYSKTIDHIVPTVRGGSNRAKNKRPCCYGCNQEKGGMMLHTYIQMLNLMQAEVKVNSAAYNLLQLKIVNANKIAIEISKHD